MSRSDAQIQMDWLLTFDQSSSDGILVLYAVNIPFILLLSYLLEHWQKYSTFCEARVGIRIEMHQVPWLKASGLGLAIFGQSFNKSIMNDPEK